MNGGKRRATEDEKSEELKEKVMGEKESEGRMRERERESGKKKRNFTNV